MFDIRWRITTLCNYQCAFCIQGDWQEHLKQADGESRQLRNRICNELIRLLEGLTSRYGLVKVALIGGELTVLDGFPEILEKLALCSFPGEIRFDITTNFSQETRYFCELCDIIQKKAKGRRRSMKIGASFYSAYVTEEVFTEKLRAVYTYSRSQEEGSNPIYLTAGVPILTDADCGVLNGMQNVFATTDVRIAPIFIRGYATDVSPRAIAGLHEQKGMNILVTDVNGCVSRYQSIQALGAELEGTDSFCPNGYLCDAGIHSIWIDAFGNAKRCPTIGETTYLGSILKGNIELLKTPQICTADHCSCSQYRRIERTG